MPQRLPQTLLALLSATLASAQTTLNELSFGLRYPISTDGHKLPGWHLSSVNHDIQVLSDRVILTPPVPGNAKGALWSDTSAPSADWTATLEFRASGQETGSGNLQLWYAKDSRPIGPQSVYNVEEFDGLVLVIDQYGGSGGKIRGFLNDGDRNFRASASLESLAFGHCDYSYRNKGIPSKLKISNQGGLHVTVDDKACFSSDKIFLPAGYYFGITATTGENPDSFEITKFLVQTGAHQASTGQPVQQEQKMDAFPGAPEAVPDRAADQIKGQEAQFADLHNRLQSMSHHMGNMFWEVRELAKQMDQKHQEIMRKVENIGGSRETGLSSVTVDKISSMHDRSISMETDIKAVREDLEGKDFKKAMDELHTAFSFLHHNFHNELEPKFEKAIKAHSASLNHFLLAVFIVQAVFAVLYIFYKKRKHAAPKKFL
ncbi:uncharacterized protein MYCFIDRAFT_140548 [Pseudocercospora fijiensis CIRAD86]|uniref:L-type lectin-like domain-containing protein n=1 Tax=Pseudocercospora fijiensis (strain CIRAD86) TaxID=383855 RepID=M2ZNZ0_PSEFD|nr:uncharacterized protein MYCFIDRAFT_140548 [Pseudocercospora fijiensis CIRAD86]EME80799.1 hypothetical protein MYCFIDRAFT_140548 [Pseudocercospora fijiensis CIRAD86]